MMIGVLSCIAVLLMILFIAARAPLNFALLTGTVAQKDGQLVELVKVIAGQEDELLAVAVVKNNQFRASFQINLPINVHLVIHDEGKKINFPITLKKGHTNLIVGSNAIEHVSFKP